MIFLNLGPYFEVQMGFLMVSRIHFIFFFRLNELIKRFLYTFNVVVSYSLYPLFVFDIDQRLKDPSNIQSVGWWKMLRLSLAGISIISLEGDISMKAMNNKHLKHLEKIFVKFRNAFFQLIFFFIHSIFQKNFISS